MGFVLNYHYYLLSVMLLSPALCYSQDRFTRSRATYYRSSDGLGTSTGACGYGGFGRTVNDANVAGVSRLWKNGTGCGSCYQVKCAVPKLCTENGVIIVVTDYGEGDHTDFIMSSHAYARLARQEYTSELFSYGVVDVEFQKIACKYAEHHNVVIKVHENSRFPDYLGIVFLYTSGQNEILAVEVWQDYKEWRGMRRAYGAVWDIPNPPKGSITLNIQVSGSTGLQWIVVNNAIPSDWKAGAAYESSIQL